MKRPAFVLLFIGATCTLSSLVHSQTITQDEFLDQLKQRHPLFQKERVTAQIQREERNSLLGAQDWNVFSSLNFSHQEPAIAFAGPERTDVLSVQGSLERRLWRTGAQFSASFSSSWADSKVDPRYGFPDSFYQRQLALTYTHPLWQNRGGLLDRLSYELKQFDIDFSEVQALENQEEFLARSAARFLDWVFLTEQKRIISERLSLSEEELARTKRKRRANLVDEVDVIRAEDAVRIWKQQQVLVQSQWDGMQAELAVLSQNDDLYSTSPKFDLYEVKGLIPLEEATSQLEERSRLLQTLRIRLKQLEYARTGVEEGLKPQLSVVTQLNTKSLDEGFIDALNMDKPDALIGVQFRAPLERRTARSQIAKTDLQIARLRKQIDEVALTLTSTLANLHIQIGELEDVLRLNQGQIQSAKERTEEESKLYNRGRGELTFVILSRDNEENAKLTYAQNARVYHTLIIQYRALVDELYE